MLGHYRAMQLTCDLYGSIPVLSICFSSLFGKRLVRMNWTLTQVHSKVDRIVLAVASPKEQESKWKMEGRLFNSWVQQCFSKKNSLINKLCSSFLVLISFFWLVWYFWFFWFLFFGFFWCFWLVLVFWLYDFVLILWILIFSDLSDCPDCLLLSPN